MPSRGVYEDPRPIGSPRPRQYRWFVLATFILYMALYVVAIAIVVAANDVWWVTWVLWAVVILATVLPGLAVLVRRLHDTGRSAWWFIGFVPIVGYLVLIVFLVSSSDPDPTSTATRPARERASPWEPTTHIRRSVGLDALSRATPRLIGRLGSWGRAACGRCNRRATSVVPNDETVAKPQVSQGHF